MGIEQKTTDFQKTLKLFLTADFFLFLSTKANIVPENPP